MSKQPTHGLDYQGGMLQSWNKLCFTGGYIEVSVSLPGSPQISGFWPGTWLRSGYESKKLNMRVFRRVDDG